MIRERTLVVGGLRFALREAGDGPLALCLHGFPDTAHTWDDLLPRLAAAGYRAVAPFLRGYAPSDLAPDGDYRVQALAADALGLAAALDDGPFVLVTHDWGAVAGYYVAHTAPERVAAFVAAAIPHPRALATDARTLWRFRYMARLAGRRVTLGHAERLLRRWSPSWRPTEAQLAPLRRSLGRPENLRAALSYYRALPLSLAGGAPQLLRRTPVPTLCLFGDEDGCAAPATFRRSAEGFEDGRVVELPGTGHFLHLEAPDAFTREVLAFLDATRGRARPPRSPAGR